MFIKREAFESVGRFPSRAMFEDLDFSRRMRRQGRTVLLASAVETSGRRFLEGGVFRTAARMAWLKLCYASGVDLERAARKYRRKASSGSRSGVSS